MSVVTRFAPSPTGFLHIGGARTALFNYLFAKQNNGKFLLRIEDTDKERSTQEAIDAILTGMSWLELQHDDEVVYQSRNISRHQELVKKLLDEGKAYKCFTSKEELADLRLESEKNGKMFKYPNIWRDITEDKHPENKPYVVRIKAPLKGDIVIEDMVQGRIAYPANEIDDMILLRADATPTYLMAVVADDHDMAVTHVIRGDDHMTNSFRQKVIFDSLGFEFPQTAHIPLIHGSDGAKLSKRHGALGVMNYEEMGYIPQALRNYLMGLGWSYGEEDIISIEEAIKRFDIGSIVRSPARIDFKKMNHINSLYLRNLSEEELINNSKKFFLAEYSQEEYQAKLPAIEILINDIAQRSDNYIDIVSKSAFIFQSIPLDADGNDKAKNIFETGKDEFLNDVREIFSGISASDWQTENIANAMKNHANDKGYKLGKFMPFIRCAVFGTMDAPSLDKILYAIGKEEALNRLSRLYSII